MQELELRTLPDPKESLVGVLHHSLNKPQLYHNINYQKYSTKNEINKETFICSLIYIMKMTLKMYTKTLHPSFLPTNIKL